jgi:hypothetical protein
MWNDKPDGYPIPVQNPTGMSMNFYPWVWVRVWISTCNSFAGGRVIALPDLNLTHCHPYYQPWIENHTHTRYPWVIHVHGYICYLPSQLTSVRSSQFHINQHIICNHQSYSYTHHTHSKLFKSYILYIRITHLNSFMSILMTYRYATSTLNRHMTHQHPMPHQHLIITTET